jgi:hypothetical protein
MLSSLQKGGEDGQKTKEETWSKTKVLGYQLS